MEYIHMGTGAVVLDFHCQEVIMKYQEERHSEQQHRLLVSYIHVCVIKKLYVLLQTKRACSLL